MSATTRSDTAGTPHLLPLSASTPTGLEEATAAMAQRLDSGGARLADIARTLRTEHPALEFRRVVVASEAAEASHYLRKRDPRRVFTARSGPGRSAVFMFSGVGDQYPGLAAGPYRHWPAFQRELDRCFRLLEPELEMDLHDVLYPAGTEDQRPASRSRRNLAELFDQSCQTQGIHRTLVAQPVVFAVQYAMARALQSLGVEPTALLGYSIGEYIAACLAGLFPLDDALRLVALRARLVAELPEGAMLAVMSAAPPLEPYLDGPLAIAALDGPELTVLSGPVNDVERAAKRLTDAGIACRRLPTSHAFHSPMMNPAVRPLEDLLRTFALKPPAIPVLSNVTGTWMRAAEATSPGYWGGHLCRSVRFADELAEVWKLPAPVLLELGPGTALTTLALQSPACPDEGRSTLLHVLPGPFESRSDLVVLLTAIGRLWTYGAARDFPDLTEHPAPRSGG